MVTGDGHELEAAQKVQRQQTMGQGVGGRMRLFSVWKSKEGRRYGRHGGWWSSGFVMVKVKKASAQSKGRRRGDAVGLIWPDLNFHQRKM